MAFFLRYTDKLELDLERKTSVHLCDGAEGADEFVEGLGYVQILNGLCGFAIEADNEEEAIEEAIEAVKYNRKRLNANASGEEYGRHAFLFEGNYTGDCVDGDLFSPSRVVKNITKIS
jgi:hypothetical protein